MRVARATLIGRAIKGWPDDIIAPSVPLGKVYRVDLDSEVEADLHNPEYPSWGVLQVRSIRDIDDGGLLPLELLRIES